MKWLRALIPGWISRPGTAVDDQANGEAIPPDHTRHRLAVLVRDAAGPSAYRLHTFEDTDSAEAFFQFWFSPGFEHGVLTFWATHQKPAQQAGISSERPTEAVVLIRDETKPEVVYPFSFSDMALAHSWLAREVARGLNLGSAIVYWATPVRISTDHWGKTRITPSEPPDLVRPEREAARTPTRRTRFTVGQRELSKEPTGRRAHQTPDGSDKVEEGRNGAKPDEVAEVLREVDRVIRRKRLDQGEEPFKGFGSPPGKF